MMIIMKIKTKIIRINLYGKKFEFSLHRLFYLQNAIHRENIYINVIGFPMSGCVKKNNISIYLEKLTLECSIVFVWVT